MSVILYKVFKQINKEIDSRRKDLLKEAAKHVQTAMKKRVNDVYFEGYHSQPGEPPGKVTGNLRKGIQNQATSEEAIVGIKSPGYHAHLMEFGTDDRDVKTKNRKWRFVGHVEPRPFVLPTWLAEKEKVKEILSRPWA